MTSQPVPLFGIFYRTTVPRCNRNSSVTPLRKFLEATSLLSDTDEEGPRGKDPGKNDVPVSAPEHIQELKPTPTKKVTISTCHSAKGLEWPVVFVPAGKESLVHYEESTGTQFLAIVENRIFPFLKAEDIEEERYSKSNLAIKHLTSHS